MVDLKAQYREIHEEVRVAIDGVLDSAHFILGPEVEAFESEFAAYCQSGQAVGLNSGTAALHLALLAMGVGPGDEVITVSYTFVATVAAIRYTGATPVLLDVDPESLNLDPTKLEAAITPRTRVVIPVHLHGQCADMDPILEICHRRGVRVLEDAAQAHGAEYRGRRAGSLGDAACFSFYPGKNLGAYGEGGAFVTSDPELASRVRVLRDHGQTRKYHHELVGYNFRLEALQGAVLRVKLRHLDAWTELRRAHAASYRSALADLAGLWLLPEMDYGQSAYHLFPVFTPARDELQAALAENGVTTVVHYPIPVHLQPAYADLGYGRGSLPQTERAAGETLSLPMYPELTNAQVEVVTSSVREWASASR